MKRFFLICFLISSLSALSQKEKSAKIGQTTLEEVKMSMYEKDSTASAVVLYDEENYFHTEYNSKKRVLAKDCYFRYKILKNEGLEKGSFTFYFGTWMEISEIKGITYNLGENSEIIKTELTKENVIIDTQEEYVRYLVNFPNVKVGSVIELQYRVSGMGRSIDNWYFQSDIPKLKSKISRLTPKTMNYIVNLTGLQQLDNQENIETVKCFPEKRKSLECRYASYEMKHIPAFRKESFMPHQSTLISKLSFRLSYFIEKGLWPYRMMTKWTQFDKGMKQYYFDKEMTKKSFFKRIIPDSIYKNGSKLTIAKNIYYFIQNHYSWNGKETGDLRRKIRRHFRKQEASVDLISTTLYNALKAADIESYYVAVSTRSKGPIDKEFPNFRDFNYTVVKAVIDGQSYFLDATHKSLGFGYVQPFANTKEGRVLDYTVVGRDRDMGSEIYKGSYWERMKPVETSSRLINSEMNFTPEKGFFGKIKIKRSGYNAFYLRSHIDTHGKQKRKEKLEDDFSDFDITEYSVDNLEELNQSFQENIELEQIIEDENYSANKTRLTPILFSVLGENPFSDNQRLHPIDFIYNRNLKYRFTFNIPKGYDVINLPKSKRFLFPDKGGSYLYQVKKDGNKVRIFINFRMLKSYYDVNQYSELKKLFDDISVLEKTSFELIKN